MSGKRHVSGRCGEVATLGKKLSSAVAVACVWVGGSTLAQIFYLALSKGVAGLPHLRGTESGVSVALWFAVGTPLVVALGGSGAVCILRWASGWPRMPLGRLFLRALCMAMFALVVIPLDRPRLVDLAAGILGVAAAMSLAWWGASRGTLGTHLFPGSTRVPNAGEKAESQEQEQGTEVEGQGKAQ